MTKLTASRKQLAQDGVKVSVNDFIVKACAVALQVGSLISSADCDRQYLVHVKALKQISNTTLVD